MKRVFIAVTALSLGLASLQAAAIKKGDASRGETLTPTCAACHGQNGDSQSSAFPRIAGQYADYMVKALKDYKSGARQNPIMAGIAAGLSEQDMQDVAAYFSQQKGALYQKELR